MQLLNQEQEIRKQIFDYFGYVEDWRVLPFADYREMHWLLTGEGPGEVRFADSAERVLDDDDEEDYYEFDIYTQRHLSKWVYRGEEYTMIIVDTHTDGNQFLAIFTNALEIKP